MLHLVDPAGGRKAEFFKSFQGDSDGPQVRVNAIPTTTPASASTTEDPT